MGEHLSKEQAIAEGFDKESYCNQCNETIWHKKEMPIYTRCKSCGEILRWKELRM